MGGPKVLDLISDDQLKELVKQSLKWSDLVIRIGYHVKKPNKVGPARYPQLMSRLMKLGVSYHHLYKLEKQKPREQLSGKKRRDSRVLKRKLQNSGRLYICEFCRCEDMTLEDGMWMWNNQPLTLQVDHIHGRDFEESDELWNLRLLCPSCHTQTYNHSHSCGNKLPQKLHSSNTHHVISRREHRNPGAKALSESSKPYVCAACNCRHYKSEHGKWLWRDWPLKLECNHINGQNIPDPHNVDNLEWLCPNCHYQHSARTVAQRRSEKKTKPCTSGT